MNSVTTLVIGGFVLNAKPLEFITSQLKNYHYIDVNQLPPEFTLQSQAQTIISQYVCDKQKIQIIAYSCGGLLALTLLQLAPENIHKLIMLNSTPCFMAQENWQGISNANLQRLRQRLNKQSLTEFADYFTTLAAYPESIDKKDALQWQNLAVNRDTLMTWLELIEQSDLRPIAEKFATRIVWINSATDSLIPNPTQNSNHKIISNSTHLRMSPDYLQCIFEAIYHE
jgi:pimeloyl-[acyl-carrier protein] methyl ester esterase